MRSKSWIKEAESKAESMFKAKIDKSVDDTAAFPSATLPRNPNM